MHYVKTQLNLRLNYGHIVDEDPLIPADGLPDFLTWFPNLI
ncbi:Uncharacterized protein BN1183_CH_00520 [Pantoea ananatis]|nr:hypothetical protein PANA5342_0785 [Pantoea ananatis LMG 5342]CRH35530.1 Uncharacterized protein BN1183_CH_00520 [Pantoea ananatis]